jgi:hypothetical protein
LQVLVELQGELNSRLPSLANASLESDPCAVDGFTGMELGNITIPNVNKKIYYLNIETLKTLFVYFFIIFFCYC